MNDLYLAHHGIKGQKWGVRRYQNEDGSLTSEGKDRYSRPSAIYKDEYGRIKSRNTLGAKIGAVPGTLRAFGGFNAMANGIVSGNAMITVAGLADATIGVGMAWLGSYIGYHAGESIHEANLRRAERKSRERRE